MKHSILFSRRATDRKVDFRPDLETGSPDDQARRLTSYMNVNEAHVFTNDNIDDCTDALDALREFCYRKLFTGTTHAEFLKLDKECPEHIDWMLRIHEIETANFQAKRPK